MQLLQQQQQQQRQQQHQQPGALSLEGHLTLDQVCELLSETRPSGQVSCEERAVMERWSAPAGGSREMDVLLQQRNIDALLKGFGELEPSTVCEYRRAVDRVLQLLQEKGLCSWPARLLQQRRQAVQVPPLAAPERHKPMQQLDSAGVPPDNCTLPAIKRWLLEGLQQWQQPPPPPQLQQQQQLDPAGVPPDNCTLRDDRKQRLAAEPGALTALVRLLGSNSDGVREAAAWALSSPAAGSDNVKQRLVAEPGALTALVQLLGSQGFTQAAAARALGELAAGSESESEAAAADDEGVQGCSSAAAAAAAAALLAPAAAAGEAQHTSRTPERPLPLQPRHAATVAPAGSVYN
ncbi:hypothetical protein OEZ85_009276 [Tetradesmus obliquus]|uniref:Uncharacterized protein n=1 Tax=Tetradesmus obliquus TaxID=3088 RepID=A0ABY8UDN5_TETOB|nr:hypothetical protein OEZ85_009276 [Tetradesmus obliquus]